ncbi:hypothetical protein [Clostridium disporicum]|uniref:Uncharacterized protein n=1 Tax=Clostridium disporicum TaxID=84024 RepID=A0A174G3H4_9CLOT|nr:hypothetical protein [Clostridium disporicum]MDY3361708.1 hypothetical protein [Clostridium celatum]CUO55379.1 Uncharacterised protein [Clostridium disporicum]
MKRTFNVYSDNYFEFPDMIFVYTSITLKSRYITFNGVAIDMLNDSKFVAYKNSTIKLEVLSSFYISLYLCSFLSNSLITKLIKKYLSKYRENNLIDTTFDNLEYGDKLGYLDFVKYSTPLVYAEACENIVNFIAKSNYENRRVIHNMHSFTEKAYAKVIYCKAI